ncbi:hypothetical protein [Halomontanus rarus]|uniref:hypothetical protein n=1 Tax=Halomontanus rarus TaxID=3034020 RepID=UPI0023E8DABA|nr:hypothetical protein [Halovivax sp. TS33]
MTPNRADGSTRDVLVCADVLGAFGVTPADVRTETDARPEDRSLERTLAVALEGTRDRTAMLRQIVCRSSRGVDCSARYSTGALADELEAAFAAVDWSIEVLERNGGDRLEVRATDGAGRRRDAEIGYPETPLERDNLPAVLAGLNDEILYGVDARFVLLSSGVDRWRAALVERDELEGVRDRYGGRVPVFDRPLLPEYGIDAYESWTGGEPEGEHGIGGDSEAGPWPAWALERMRRSTSTNANTSNTNSSESANTDSTDGLIEEAEPDRSGPESRSRRETAESVAEAETTEPNGGSNSIDTLVPDAEGSSESTGNGTADESIGLEIAGGSPTVSRVSGREGGERDSEHGSERERDAHRSRIASDESERATENSTTDRNDRSAVVSRRERRETDTDGFGTLSGSTKTDRVANDSFGADVETPTDDDRYRALGAAIGTGENVSVKGLLDDDEFLPELPAADPVETRIEFADEFDPAAVPKAKAAAEESGFEWVESGSLETTRVSNES